MTKVNPFTPNNPVNEGMFIGRSFEITAFDKALTQAKNSNPTHLLLLGERGIGKTSLLNVAQTFARGEFTWDDVKHNFLSVKISLDENVCLADFALNLKGAIEREINKENPGVAVVKGIWDFVTKFEAAGIAYKREESMGNNAQLIQNFIYSLVDTVKALKNSQTIKQKDGLVILLDEADKASKDLYLGSFLKNLSETLISENCNNILFILSGLPELRNVLMQSHQSSLRLFQELNLHPLSKSETIEVINKGLVKAEKENGVKTTIETQAQDSIYNFSEGYPHFVQQIGFSVFDVDSDNLISNEDVKDGFFREHGALEMIGDRYYSKLFYRDINVDSQREILAIMSENWNEFVSRDQIKKKFTGTEVTLNNGIRALNEKGIIIPKDGVKGKYRLQWVSFAFWIRNHNTKKYRA